MSTTFPFSHRRDANARLTANEPRGTELSRQTLCDVPLRSDVDALALKRWREKQNRAISARGQRLEIPGRPTAPLGRLHRIHGADGVTRWFDDAARQVARVAPECDRCTVWRVNEDLMSTRRLHRGNAGPWIVGAALLLVAALVGIAAFF